jgi:hypothetical protein
MVVHVTVKHVGRTLTRQGRGRLGRGLVEDESGFIHAVEAVLSIFLLMFYSQSILRTPVFIRVIQEEEATRELSDQIMGILSSLDSKNFLGEAVFAADFNLLDKTLENILPEHAGFSYSISYMQPFTLVEPTERYAWTNWPVTVSLDLPKATDTGSINLRSGNGDIILPLQVSWPWFRYRIDFGHKLTSAWPNFTLPLRMCDLYHDPRDLYNITEEDREYIVNCLPVSGPADLVELEPADVNGDNLLDYPDPGSVHLYMDDWYDDRWDYRLRVSTKAIGPANEANASIAVGLADLMDAQGIPCRHGLDMNSTLIADPYGTPMNYTAESHCCGDGVCSSTENSISCHLDCPGTCGDGLCGVGESNANCDQDCLDTCGNNDCEDGEDSLSCPFDCPRLYKSSCDCTMFLNWTFPGPVSYGDKRTFFLYFNTFDVEEPVNRCRPDMNPVKVVYRNCKAGYTDVQGDFVCTNGRCSISDCRVYPRLKWSYPEFGPLEEGHSCPRKDLIPSDPNLVSTYGPVEVISDRDYVEMPMEVVDWRDGRVYEDDVVYYGLTLQRRRVREVNHSGIPSWNMQVRVVAYKANHTVELAGDVTGIAPGSCVAEAGGINDCVTVVREVDEEEQLGMNTESVEPDYTDLPSLTEPVKAESGSKHFYVCTTTVDLNFPRIYPSTRDDMDIFTINITVPKKVFDERTGVIRRNFPKNIRLQFSIMETHDTSAVFPRCMTKYEDKTDLELAADRMVVLPTGESLELARSWSPMSRPFIAPYPSSYARINFHLPFIEAPGPANQYPGEVHRDLFLYYSMGTDKDPPEPPSAPTCLEEKLYCVRGDVFFVREAVNKAPRADISWMESFQPAEHKRFYAFYRVGTNEAPVTGESDLALGKKQVCTDCFADTCPDRTCTNRRDDNNNGILDETEVRSVSNVSSDAGFWSFTYSPGVSCGVQASTGLGAVCMLNSFISKRALTGTDLMEGGRPSFTMEVPGLVEAAIPATHKSATVMVEGPVRNVVQTIAQHELGTVINLYTFYPSSTLWRMSKTIIPSNLIKAPTGKNVGNITFAFTGDWTNVTYFPDSMDKVFERRIEGGQIVEFDVSEDWITYWNATCGKWGSCGFTVALSDKDMVSRASVMPDASLKPSITLDIKREQLTPFNATTIRTLMDFRVDPAETGSRLASLQNNPFRVEYDRLIPLHGGEAVPEKTVPPHISTGTAAYVVTTNGRKVGYSWLRFHLWYA